MNSETRSEKAQFDENELDAAIAEIIGQPTDQEAAKRVQERALLIAQTETSTAPQHPEVYQSPQPRSQVVRLRWLRFGSVAASIGATILLALWLLAGSTSIAFAEVVEHVMQIRSLTFDFQVEYFDEKTQTGTMLIRDEVVRIENNIADKQLVSLVNAESGEALILDEKQKRFQRPPQELLTGISKLNPIAELIAAKDKSVKSLGSDQINGKRVEVYKVKGLSIMGIEGDSDMTLWVDTTTQLPSKIEVVDADPKASVRFVFDQFHWNASILDDKLSMKEPAGFQEAVIVQAPPKPTTAPSVDQHLENGVLFSGRVPARLAVDQQQHRVTALIRDKEDAATTFANEIRQWDLTSGELRWKESVGGAGDLAVCYSKDLLALVEGKEIQLRRLSTGKIVKTWASNHILGEVAFNADGTRLAHGYTKWGRPARSKPPTGGVEIWNVGTEKLEHHIRGLGRVNTVHFSPDGETILVCGDQACLLYNSLTAELEYSFPGARGIFSPDGKRLALVSRESTADKNRGRVQLVNVETKQVIREFTTNKGKSASYLLSLGFSPDGDLLAAANWNGTVSTWNTETGESVSSFDLPGGVHRVCFTKQNQMATGCEDAKLRLHDLDQGN